MLNVQVGQTVVVENLIGYIFEETTVIEENTTSVRCSNNKKYSKKTGLETPKPKFGHHCKLSTRVAEFEIQKKITEQEVIISNAWYRLEEAIDQRDFQRLEEKYLIINAAQEKIKELKYNRRMLKREVS